MSQPPSAAAKTLHLPPAPTGKLREEEVQEEAGDRRPPQVQEAEVQEARSPKEKVQVVRREAVGGAPQAEAGRPQAEL